METQEQTGTAVERRGVPTYAVDAGVAFALLVLALVVIVSSAKLGAGWTTDGPGSGYFPFYLGIIVALASVATLYQALFGKKRDTSTFVDAEQFKRVLTVLIPAAIYVAATVYLGLYVASAIYVAGFMFFLGKFSYVRSIVSALVMATLFFMMFEVWFKVPLFKGSLDLTGFLGY
ncbi:MAG TPA: tripartite tricarboxylate transporter TctB family protein [Ramlibacter sp.]|jgi:Tripartite tricarboxylate transporter TctB family.|nr:tripartite tricarboxylate transporter TctB family protein [Ramlibacter sp.]